MAKNEEGILIQDAEIMWPNFSGTETAFNPAGKRNFTVILTPEMEEALTRDGWNVGTWTPKDEEEEPRPKLKVKVRFDIKPPNVVLVTSSTRVPLTEDTIGQLDHMDIKRWDLFITPYDYDFQGNSGRTAYLKTMFAVLDENELEAMWAREPLGQPEGWSAP